MVELLEVEALEDCSRCLVEVEENHLDQERESQS